MRNIATAAAIVFLLAGCASQTPTQQRVTTGAAIGALGGAGIGAIAGGGKGAAIGAVAGGIGGAAVAGATAPKNCWGTDARGNRIRVVCP